MKVSKKYRIGGLAVLVMLTVMIIWIVWGNSALVVSTISVSSAKLPKAFSGYKIVQVSDLHNAEFGDENVRLLEMLTDTQADIIVITGDFVDSRRTNIRTALRFAEQAVQIAPVYYVTGNHESRIADYEALEAGLVKCGVKVLHGEVVQLEAGGQTIQLAGIDDPDFVKTDWLDFTETMAAEKEIQALSVDSEKFTVLLSHPPHLFDVYASEGIDLVFSGHAHGGQFRFPLLGGLVAPDQGLFPKYDAGLYTEGDTNMVVSRGLGNSLFPFRINNRPEIVVVSLFPL